MDAQSTVRAGRDAAEAKNLPAVCPLDRAPLIVMRQGRSLVPCSPLDVDLVTKFSPTQPIQVRLTQERHAGQHRLYWAVLTVVAQNLEPAVLPEELHEWVKLNCGAAIFDRLTGEALALTPASIAFEAMDQSLFHDFFQRVVDLLVTRILPGLSKETLTREASALMGFAA